MNTQEEHDAAHPGQVCGSCPKEVEFRQHLASIGVGQPVWPRPMKRWKWQERRDHRKAMKFLADLTRRS